MPRPNTKNTRTVGVLGGMGPAATADFYRRIVAATDASCDQEHLHVLINSYPAVPDRTACLLGRGEDPTPVLIDMAQSLEHSGADLLIMACNTANAFIDRITQNIHIPLLNWVDEAIARLLEQEPALRRIGLLATDGTLISGLYQQACAKRGLQALVPDALQQQLVMRAIYGPMGIKAGTTRLADISLTIKKIGESLQVNGADLVLLACTELSFLYGSSHLNWSFPIADAAQLVAERVVIHAGGRLKCQQPLCPVSLYGNLPSKIISQNEDTETLLSYNIL